MKRSINSIRGFKEFTNIPSTDLSSVHRCDFRKRPTIIRDDVDDVLKLVFAPDPDTGYPRSDLVYIMSSDASAEVSQYIHETLMRPRHSPSGSEDADFALDTVKNRGETIEQYAQRLRDIISKYNDLKS